MARFVWVVAAALLVLWLLGLIFRFGGGLIHILLVAALILLVYNLVTGRKSV